jgi:hypothetical protein
MNVFCVASFCIGAVLGYTLNWALRHNPKPDSKEVIALIGAVVGGVAVQLVKDLLNCPASLAWYMIGVGVGFFVYTLALWRGWEKIKPLIDQMKLAGVPFWPFKYR